MAMSQLAVLVLLIVLALGVTVRAAEQQLAQQSESARKRSVLAHPKDHDDDDDDDGDDDDDDGDDDDDDDGHNDDDDDDDDDDGDDDDDDDSHRPKKPTDLYIEEDVDDAAASFGGLCTVQMAGQVGGDVHKHFFPAGFVKNVEFSGDTLEDAVTTLGDSFSALCPTSDNTLSFVESGDSYSVVAATSDDGGPGMFVIQLTHPVMLAQVVLSDNFNNNAEITFAVSLGSKMVTHTSNAVSQNTSTRNSYTLITSQGAFDHIAITMDNASESANEEQDSGARGCLAAVSIPCKSVCPVVDNKHW